MLSDIFSALLNLLRGPSRVELMEDGSGVFRLWRRIRYGRRRQSLRSLSKAGSSRRRHISPPCVASTTAPAAGSVCLIVCQLRITAITDGASQTSKIPPGDNLNLNIFIGNPGASAWLNDSIYMRILPAEFIGKFDTRLRILSAVDRNNMVIQFRRAISQWAEAVCSPAALTAHQSSRINSPAAADRPEEVVARRGRGRGTGAVGRVLPRPATALVQSSVISPDHGLASINRPDAPHRRGRRNCITARCCRRRRRGKNSVPHGTTADEIAAGS